MSVGTSPLTGLPAPPMKPSARGSRLPMGRAVIRSGLKVVCLCSLVLMGLVWMARPAAQVATNDDGRTLRVLAAARGLH